jgi:PHD/YefM family antitoxin component YafN of YafNO toxin-antitoxin module
MLSNIIYLSPFFPLDSIKERRVEKVAILRKNKIEAVIIPIEEYEKIQSDSQCLEHMHIYRQLKEREGTQLEEYIDFDTLLADYGLRKDEL